MALPIGGTPFRGMPPDKMFFTSDLNVPHTQNHHIHTAPHHSSRSFVYHNNEMLHTFHLLDSSIVTTSHPTLDSLFISLQRQLFHHVHNSKFVHFSQMSHMCNTHTHTYTDMSANSMLNNFDDIPNITIPPLEHIPLHSPKSVILTQTYLDSTSDKSNIALNATLHFPFLHKSKKEPFFHHPAKKSLCSQLDFCTRTQVCRLHSSPLLIPSCISSKIAYTELMPFESCLRMYRLRVSHMPMPKSCINVHSPCLLNPCFLVIILRMPSTWKL